MDVIYGNALPSQMKIGRTLLSLKVSFSIEFGLSSHNMM